MKKIISIIISTAMLLSCLAAPAKADYTTAVNDIERVRMDYNTDGTVTNDIDSTLAYQAGSDEVTIGSFNGSHFQSDYFMSFDFKFDNDSGNILMSNSKGKIGPNLTCSDGQLRTQTGGSSYTKLGAFTVGEWYTLELEGTMARSGARTDFRLYSYVEGVKTLVQTTEKVYLRNFDSGTNGTPGNLKLKNVSIDNIVLISEYADKIEVTADTEEIDAGDTLVLDHSITRLGKELAIVPVVEWSVWDEAGTGKVEAGIIMQEGSLVTAATVEEQTVTVKATATAGNNTVVGEKQIKINAVSIDNEKFDTISVTGSQTVKAGTSTTYSFTASKNGTDVTDTLTDEDVAWAVYQPEGIFPNGNTGIKIENGVLTVDEDIIKQDIIVRASSASGVVSDSMTVGIEFADSQKETVLTYGACETELEGMELVTSVDGSNAYTATASTRMFSFSNTTSYTVTELDVRFNSEKSGFALQRSDGGKTNTGIDIVGGKISVQTAGNKWESTGISATAGKWYHIELLYSSSNASINVYEYNDNGTLGDRQTATNIARRNSDSFGALLFENGVTFDNVKVYTPIADTMTVTPEQTTMFAGLTNQIDVSYARKGLPLLNTVYTTDVQWFVINSNNEEITDESITISDGGLLTVDALAPTQTITVEVVATGGIKETLTINIVTSDSFNVTNIGINEEGTKIVRLYVEKTLYYTDSVAFMIAIKSATGELKGLKLIKANAEDMELGNNEITLDYTIPETFDPGMDIIEAFAWTTIE